MVSDANYELCLPILQDETIEEEDKTEKLEELLRKDTSLTEKALENAVLDSLWRFKASAGTSSSPPPTRHTIVRRPSPAPWQLQRAGTPMSSSPRSVSAAVAPPPGFGIAPPAFTRAKSSAASPFTSPKPSPRLAFSTPQIPHSPSLNAYEFSESSPNTESYGDYGSDNVDWLVNDDITSNASSYNGEGGLSGAATEWVQPYTVDMSPYDMLRSILRDEKTDEELEKVLEMNGFDLSQTIMALTETQAFDTPQAGSSFTGQERTFLVGKSMSPTFRPATPAGQAKSGVVCRYWLANGNCARADCRFSHDLSNHICKYWLMGNCLAGEGCIFSHDPSALINRLLIDGGSTPPTQYVQPNLQLQDYDSFPALHPVDSDPYQQSFDPSGFEAFYGANVTAAPPPGLSPFPPEFIPNGSSLSRPQSRPTSQYQSRAPTPAAPALDDNEAFPTLGSAAAKPGKRHHGKRGGHGHGHKDNGPSSLADLVRMSPSPSVTPLRRGLKSSKSYTGSRENSAAAQAIPAPEHVPWLETGDNTNKAYLRARSEAFKHGGLRNKFLQSAAQAWNRNDSRGAKALSLRGQNENNLMREAHREAARCLYEERNKNAATSKELYVDLHGLHPEEAVSYLERCLFEQQSSARPVYAITGTGHHSKNGKDKVGKSIRTFLNEWRYAFREFSVPGDRNNVGGILGFDPTSFERDALKKAGSGGAGEVDKENTGEVNDSSGLGKVRLVKAEEVDIPRGPRRRL